MTGDQGGGGTASVEVVGTGSVEVPSDRLRVRFGAEARAASVAEAFDAADAALKRMVAVLREHGATDADLRSTEIELHPDHEKGGEGSGFRAAMGVAS